MTERRLLVRHLNGTSPPHFLVQRLSDDKSAHPDGVAVRSPVGLPVAGRTDRDLVRDLQWYLEEFLNYPYEPDIEIAERVREALRAWGTEAFRALFDGGTARDLYHDATRDGPGKLHLRIASDDPAVLAWPWEALHDSQAGRLAPDCLVDRQLSEVHDPPPLPPTLPRDRVNVLLVIARPYENDVRFRSIARPLIELTRKLRLPAAIHVLRPPTFDRLRQHLRERPGYYHILHFDGHGSYRADGNAPAGFTFQGPQGRLVFETADGEPDPVDAETLNALLKEHAVPAVVLNACQSAMVDDSADNPYASVAAALLRAGMRGVVAMAYSLYVSAAQHFLPAFYQRLFETGSLAQAVRAGRQELLAHPGRVCARGTYPLEDWFVPVLYQQDPLDFSFAAQARAPDEPATLLAEEARDGRNPYGLVGRDGAILELERAMHRKPAGLLVNGMGGVGKTTLARGFLQWLDETHGLERPPFWISFEGLRSVEYVFNRLGEALCGPNFATLAMKEKVAPLVKACRQRRLVIVWDNFESARGVPGTAITANLSDEDCGLLREFLAGLYGGPTKVLITSRTTEDWLGHTNRWVLQLGGLDGEERAAFANDILRDLGKKVDREDKDFAKLLELLRGHPLAMRVILPRLEKRTAGDLVAALQANFESLKLDATDENEARLYATLRLATDALPADWRPLLIALALHEGYCFGALLTSMTQLVEPGFATEAIADGLHALTDAGLLTQVGTDLYLIHPALSGYLLGQIWAGLPHATQGHWQKAFAGILASFSTELADQPSKVQGRFFQYYAGNLHRAREFARLPELYALYLGLALYLAAYAESCRAFEAAEKWWLELSELAARNAMQDVVAFAYHQIGICYQQRRDWAAAEGWYRKSLEISPVKVRTLSLK